LLAGISQKAKDINQFLNTEAAQDFKPFNTYENLSK